jgi:P27 family predicted phage terminase small subunit
MEGTLRPDRMKNEPQPASSSKVPRAPSGLGKYGLALWKRLAPKLHRSDLLTEVDELGLELLCRAYDVHRRALDLLKPKDGTNASDNPVLDSGLLSLGSKGQLRRHPAADVALSYLNATKSLMVEFGMTPVSRGRVNLPLGELEDPLAELLAKRDARPPSLRRPTNGEDEDLEEGAVQ